MKTTVTATFAVCALTMALWEQPATGQAGASGSYTLSPVANGMQLKTPDGRVVLEYLTSKPAGVPLTGPNTACFHPINTPSGERVTALAPDDHPHHRGMYIAWHDSEFRQPITRSGPTSPLLGWNITKADFWGWGVYAPRDGRVIETREVKLKSADASSAVIEIRNDWSVNKRKLAEETTLTTVVEREWRLCDRRGLSAVGAGGLSAEQAELFRIQLPGPKGRRVVLHLARRHRRVS